MAQFAHYQYILDKRFVFAGEDVEPFTRTKKALSMVENGKCKPGIRLSVTFLGRRTIFIHFKPCQNFSAV